MPENAIRLRFRRTSFAKFYAPALLIPTSVFAVRPQDWDGNISTSSASSSDAQAGPVIINRTEPKLDPPLPCDPCEQNNSQFPSLCASAGLLIRKTKLRAPAHPFPTYGERRVGNASTSSDSFRDLDRPKRLRHLVCFLPVPVQFPANVSLVGSGGNYTMSRLVQQLFRQLEFRRTGAQVIGPVFLGDRRLAAPCFREHRQRFKLARRRRRDREIGI
jgi:hypothetical protein